MWAIKALLQLFELISGMTINFHKSSLVGLNVSSQWMKEAALFLNYKTGSISFIYLGLPVGADTRRLATWRLVVDKVR